MAEAVADDPPRELAPRRNLGDPVANNQHRYTKPSAHQRPLVDTAKPTPTPVTILMVVGPGRGRGLDKRCIPVRYFR